MHAVGKVGGGGGWGILRNEGIVVMGGWFWNGVGWYPFTGYDEFSIYE